MFEAPLRTQTRRADGDTGRPPCALGSLSRGVMSPVVNCDWPSPAFQSHLYDCVLVRKVSQSKASISHSGWVTARVLGA